MLVAPSVIELITMLVVGRVGKGWQPVSIVARVGVPGWLVGLAAPTVSFPTKSFFFKLNKNGVSG